ncbi:MAG TPA: DegT/DnrJ/EryC1/StrS family aminotransferase [Candidatus Binatia bacterium]|nr:DegT/DnrJ/EryC1/StrS family aminotransferase [Candidatus Binatia bacterium]
MTAGSPLRIGKKRANELARADKTCAKNGVNGRPENFHPVPIPLLDLTRKYRSIDAELHRQWNLTFESMRLLNGRNLAAFEEEFAAYCNVRHAIGVGSGTDAIFLSLRALGIGAGDEVILPAHAPAPVIEPILYVGATPVLIDKASGDYGPDLAGLRDAITAHTKAVLAVHLLGLPCDMDAIGHIVSETGVPVVEDSSQAQGAMYRGKRAAGLGAITPMSLGPVKNLACYGDGGVVLTNDGELARTVRLLRVHGQSEKYNHKIYGWNSRLDELQAAVLRVKLPFLDRDNARRRDIADAYTRELSRFRLKTPPVFDDRQSVYHQYVIETPYRDELKSFLAARQIGTGIYYPVPLHRHEAWVSRGFRQLSLPEAERYSSQNIALPMFAELTDDEIDWVIGAVKEFFSAYD